MRTEPYEYDLVVIGAGPGGYEAALEAAGRFHMKTALIELDQIGGTCLNRGCIPTKTLLHASGLYRRMLECGRFGLKAEEVCFSMEEIQRYKSSVLEQLQNGILTMLKKQKVEVIQGSGSIQNPHTVLVTLPDAGTKLLKTCNILIATGSAPALPPIPGKDLPGVVTSDELLEQASCLPGHLTIIGGGVIGVEFATVFSDLGTQVTILEALPRILPNMDRELSQSLKMLLKKRGADIHTGAFVKEIVQGDGRKLLCRYQEKEAPCELPTDCILICTGRKPRTDGLFAEHAVQNGQTVVFSEDPHGDETDAGTQRILLQKGFIQTDASGRTGIPNIYAIGDVTGGVMLAHAAAAMGRYVVAHMAGASSDTALSVIPSCIYTDPEIASVGLTPDQAKERGIEAESRKYPMSANGKTLLSGQERGFMKVVYEKDSLRILGAQMMCERASDMISEFTSAIVENRTLSDMARIIRPHPTFSEAITELARQAASLRD